ncbi:MAG TPA: protein kinase, partial [Gemmataceae bacterium]
MTAATSPPSSDVRAAELADVLEWLTARVHAGQPVDLDAVLRDHPDHAAEVRRLLPALALLADLSGAATGVGVPGVGPLGELGDFRLLREVGRGGMGIVYEAEQVSLGRRVALKVLPFAATMDPKQLQRFRNEAKAAAGLHHEHIVPVYAVGCERGVHYYAMQFIDGQTLAALVTELRRASSDTPPHSAPSTQDLRPSPDPPPQEDEFDEVVTQPPHPIPSGEEGESDAGDTGPRA